MRVTASGIVALLTALIACMSGMPSRATDSVAPPLERQCRAVAAIDFSGIVDARTQVTRSSVVSGKSGPVAYCSVEGYIHPQIGFELRLPVERWNGKFIEVGCGGWCGSVSAFACNGPLERGYACIASDMGHRSGGDALWADGNLQALIDFGYRATHVTALAGKAIAERFYSKPPQKSYFMGCSTGGYQGVTSAQRFPWDFDGIVAGAPDMDGGESALRAVWIYRTLFDESGAARLSDKDLQLVHDAALARCDKDDGVPDGVIGNPLACQVDPQSLVCESGQAERCLTPTKADTVRKLYAGPMSSKGERISSGGFPAGSELSWTDLGPPSAAEDFFRYAIPGYSTPPQWKYTDYDFDRDPKRLGLAAYYDNSNPDLHKFEQAGAKLIVFHGATDTINLPGAMTRYYETVERTMGGRAATQEFFRLFLVPGMNHCGGGAGAFAVDWLTALEAWVEHGQAPDVLVSAHVSEDYLARAPLLDLPMLPPDLSPERRAAVAAQLLRYPLKPEIPVQFSRPVYPYPLYARYRGSGDVRSAMNYGPVAP